MLWKSSLLMLACSSSLAYGVSLISLDAATFYQNGQDAQKLNAEFATLNVTDACNYGRACVNGSVAQCVNGIWKTEACATSEQCFALPAVRRNGTFLSCTTEAVAMSLINATGVEGGIAFNNSTGSDSNSTTASPISCSSSVSLPPSATANASEPIVVVTETVTVLNTATTITPSTVAPSPVTTFAETTVLDPAQASSLLASLTAGGSFSIVTTLAPPSSSFAVSFGFDTDPPQAATTLDILLADKVSAALSATPVPTIVY